MITTDLIDQEKFLIDQAVQANYIGNVRSSINIQGFQKYLNQLGPLPDNTLFIGMCEDGLPLLFDLMDPTPESILVVGKQWSGKTTFLKSLIISSILCSSNRTPISFSVITPNIGEYQELSSFSNCTNIYSSYDRTAGEHIVELSTIAEQRRTGRNRGTAHLLLVDNLEDLFEINDFDTLNHLHWLVNKGALSACWTIASLELSSNHSKNIDFPTQFHTQIYCQNNHAIGYGSTSLANRPQSNGYMIQAGTSASYFWLPE